MSDDASGPESPADGPRRMLGGLSPVRFLDRHWQKGPLLVRGAFPDSPCISREELVELACDPGVRSRLVSLPPNGTGRRVRPGPFPAGELDDLADPVWTLLVQEVDRHVPACAALLEQFRFVPNWRIDDLMVSYATDGGGVGPHIDRYDVFLVQLEGRRRWRIESAPRMDLRLSSETPLPVLAQFEPDREWIVEAGDLLYLPPGLAHDGVALGECVTGSVGFRVPDPRELCAGFLTQLAPRDFDATRYSDPGLKPPHLLGEISEEARRQLRDSARGLFSVVGGFDRWIGRFVTTPLRGDPPAPGRIGSAAELWERLERGATLGRSAPAHFAWYRDDEGRVQLFVGGEHYPFDRGWEDLAELLCGSSRLDAIALGPHIRRPHFAGVLIDLVLRGYLVLLSEPSSGG